MGRMSNTIKNFRYSAVSEVIRMGLNFVSRTIFLYILGVAYSGVSGLYTNLLGVLSLAEMGFSSAMAFALYKPVAENDIEKLKSLMNLYKKIYRIIAIIILCIGLSLVPFLKYIIKGGEEIGYDKLTIYYLFFLAETVLSYFVTYKYSITYAEQKGYIFTKYNTIFNFIITMVRTVVLIAFRSYLIYLISGLLVGVIQKIYMGIRVDKMYPYLNEKDCKKLPEEDISNLKKNVKALVFHSVGDKCINQTDNIIVSAFVGIRMTGCLSYYMMFFNVVNSFINSIIYSAVSSIGNVFAVEKKDKQKEIINKYIFLNSYLTNCAVVVLCICLSPFVEVLWGKDIVISDSIVFFFSLSTYISYQLNCLNYLKSAAGIFDQDKFVPLVQAIINLTVSVVLAMKFGVEGVYIGTIVQGVVAIIWKAIVIYKELFQGGTSKYFLDLLYRLCIYLISIMLCSLVKHFIVVNEVTIFNCIALAITSFLITNIVYIVGTFKSAEMKYYICVIREGIRKCTHI